MSDPTPEDVRAGYTWSDAARDLALTSTLTMREAGEIRRNIDGTSVHPYDALMPLARLFTAGASIGEQADALGLLLSLASRHDTSA